MARKAIPKDIDTRNPAPAPCESDADHEWVNATDMNAKHCPKCGRFQLTD